MMPAIATTPSRAISKTALVAEKRIRKIDTRIGDTLHALAQERARQSGTTLSNYVVHVLACDLEGQAPSGQTLADDARHLANTLLTIASELGTTTALQRLWLSARISSFQTKLAGGRR